MRSPAAGGGRPVERLERDERRLGGDVDVRCRRAPARTRPWNGAISDVSIFMASTTATTSPGVDLVTDGNGDRHDHGGREVADEAAVVARDAVRHAVDLDEQVGVLDGGQRAVAHAVHLEPALVAAERAAA